MFLSLRQALWPFRHVPPDFVAPWPRQARPPAVPRGRGASRRQQKGREKPERCREVTFGRGREGGRDDLQERETSVRIRRLPGASGVEGRRRRHGGPGEAGAAARAGAAGAAREGNEAQALGSSPRPLVYRRVSPSSPSPSSPLLQPLPGVSLPPVGRRREAAGLPGGLACQSLSRKEFALSLFNL